MKVGDKMPSVVEGVIIENCNGTINLGDKYNVQPIEKRKLIMDRDHRIQGLKYKHLAGLVQRM